ncbi:hypothetical protein BH11PAT4_BH11PAT4_7660 [soil metagenome]
MMSRTIAAPALKRGGVKSVVRVSAFKRVFVRALAVIGTGTLMFLSLLLTFLIMANSAELLLGRDLPVVNAISPIPVAETISENTATQTVQTDIGTFGVPAYLKVGTKKIRMQLVPALKDEDGYLGRAAAAHFTLLSPSKNGNIGNVLVYARQSWRTIDGAGALKVGENIFLDTASEWRYMYRVSDTVTVPYNTAYVVPDGLASRLTVALFDEQTNEVTYVTADFVTLQNTSL